MKRFGGVAVVAGLVVAGLIAGRSVMGAARPKSEDLIYAALRGDAAEAKRCLQAGVSPDTRGPNGYTPLHFAALRGDVAVTRLLVERGANVNARSADDGFTPLHVVARQGSEQVADLLLDRGADPRAHSKQGTLPEVIALRQGHVKLAVMLHDRWRAHEDATP